MMHWPYALAETPRADYIHLRELGRAEALRNEAFALDRTGKVKQEAAEDPDPEPLWRDMGGI